jgi:hypothetical protein
MYNRRNWQFWVFVFVAWVTFPLTAIWIFFTHPGKCALILKKEITGSWFKPNQALDSNGKKPPQVS